MQVNLDPTDEYVRGSTHSWFVNLQGKSPCIPAPITVQSMRLENPSWLTDKVSTPRGRFGRGGGGTLSWVARSLTSGTVIITEQPSLMSYAEIERTKQWLDDTNALKHVFVKTKSYRMRGLNDGTARPVTFRVGALSWWANQTYRSDYVLFSFSPSRSNLSFLTPRRPYWNIPIGPGDVEDLR